MFERIAERAPAFKLLQEAANRRTQGWTRWISLENLQSTDKPDTRGDHLRELMKQFRAAGQLPGSNEQGHAARALGEHAIEAGLQVALAAHAHHLVRHLAVLEKQQRRNGIDSIVNRELLILIDVHLPDRHLAVVF